MQLYAKLSEDGESASGREYFQRSPRWMSWEILQWSPFLQHTWLLRTWRRLIVNLGSAFQRLSPGAQTKWIKFPFRDKAAKGAHLTVTKEDQLIQISTDGTLEKRVLN